MRIVHIVTLVSEDAAFGGPLRVALNQIAELRSRGHDAFLIAGYRGPLPPPAVVDGVPALLFPVRAVLPWGFSGLVSLGMLKWLRRHLAQADVVHVHLGRDLVGLSASAMVAWSGRPLVVQTHGMVPPDARVVARVVDSVATRPLLRRADVRLVLNDREEAELSLVLGRVALHRLPNGVPISTDPAPAERRNEVLYLARLHPRKRPLAFVEVAHALCSRYPETRWSMVGPDEGALPAVLDAAASAGLGHRFVYEGPLGLQAVADRLRQAAVYVLPSVDEPFPMSLLEALAEGVPSVCTSSCGIAEQLLEAGAALVVDESQEELTAAVDRLLGDPALRESLGRAARVAVADRFGMRQVIDELERIYVGSKGRASGGGRGTID